MQRQNPAAAPEATQSNLSPLMGDTDDESDLDEIPLVTAEEITVAVFCALSCESVAVKYTLDKEFQCRLKSGLQKYVYSFGQIGDHKVIIARPNQIGKVNIAQLAATISQQFRNVRFALMIGIGAGIPDKRDIRLGDIAVSIPMDSHPGVLEYDFGNCSRDGFTLKGSLNKPPSILLSADGQLEDEERMNKKPLRKILKRITEKPGYERPNNADVLFDPTFHHVSYGSSCDRCEESSEKKVINRLPRQKNPGQPVVHRGLILSGGLVVKNPEDRDLLRRGRDAICYEMEAAGIMDQIPCLVVRGISDYADTHKQDAWHCYAAAVAAAYGKAILCKIDCEDLEETTTLRDMMQLDKKMDTVIEGVFDLQRGVSNTHEVVRKISRLQQGEKQTRILEWVDPGTASSRRSAVVAVRQIGTGKWFLNQSAFTKWSTQSEGSSNILWCYGIPGAGKSTISTLVVDQLEKQQKQQQTTVAYFYFDFSNKEIDTRKFTRSLLKQLVLQSSRIPRELGQLFETYSHLSRTEKEDQKIEDLMVQSVSKSTYIVVDALDECDPELRFDVLGILRKLADSGARIFATSRPHPEDINEAFKDVDKIELNAEANDIRKYIDKEIRKHNSKTPTGRHIGSELKTRIMEGLVQKSNGMFLLPKLQLKFLLKQACLHRVETVLKTILKMSISGNYNILDETYNLMFDSIDEANKDIAYKALSWLAATKYPLQIQDLLVALAIEPGSSEIVKSQELLQSTVLDICAGFIIVDRSSRIAKLAHETVQEYLLRKHIKATNALESLTRTCLNYLSFKKFADSGFWGPLGNRDSIRLGKVEQIPFYLYAVQNWEAQVIECDQEAIACDLIGFLNRRSSVLSYCQARKLTVIFKQPDPRCFFYCVGTDESPLHTAARIGHLGAIRHYISEGINVDIKHNGNLQPIWEAVAFGQIEAIKLLRENGSNTKIAWNPLGQPIHLAAALGNFAIVKYFLDMDPGVINIQNAGGYSPLHECTLRGYCRIAELLLDAGADWRLELKKGESAAHVALERGWPDVFSLFLKRGIDLTSPLTKLCNSGAPLHVAAFFGQEEAVKEILDVGARDCISLSDSVGNTALHSAIFSGSLPIVQLLFENGINVNKRNKDGKTALELANELRFTNIQQYLRKTTRKKCQNCRRRHAMLDSLVTQDSHNFSESYQVTEGISMTDIIKVYGILTRKLNISPPVAKNILDHASYWIEQHVKRLERAAVDFESYPAPYLHLEIRAPFVRRIKFRTISHDQGWSGFPLRHEPYEVCDSWIEIRRHPRDSKLLKSQTFERNKALSTRLVVQYTVNARLKSTEHTNEWDLTTTNNPDLVKFLSALRSGDRITLYPMAEHPGSECVLEEAELWVYSSIWEYHRPLPSGESHNSSGGFRRVSLTPDTPLIFRSPIVTPGRLSTYLRRYYPIPESFRGSEGKDIRTRI